MSPAHDESAAAERRRAFRRIARRYHPDLGGDPERYIAAIAALEREAASLPGTTPIEVRRSHALRRAARRLRMVLRAWQAERRRARRAEVDARLSGGRVPSAGPAVAGRRRERRRLPVPTRRHR